MLNIASCFYASSFNIATVNLLSPILTPFADQAFLGANIPRPLWTSLWWTTGGCVVMIYGEWSTR